MTPADYIRRELAAGRLTFGHLALAVCHFQAAHDLHVDGMPGPETRAALGLVDGIEPILFIDNGIVYGDVVVPGPPGQRIRHVRLVASHPSWSQGSMTPSAIVAHYTATDPGTAEAMARRRVKPRRLYDRAASWHFTVTAEGEVIQQMSCLAQGMHCKDQRGTGARVALLDHRGRASAPNACAIGIELEGHGDTFPPAQVEAARQLWAALVAAYDIPRKQAMVAHSDLDPHRRSDPGILFMDTVAPSIIAAAFPAQPR